MKRRNVDLYREQKTIGIYYDVNEHTLWRVDETPPSSTVHWLGYFSLLFVAYLLQPYYSAHWSYVSDGIILALACVVSIWVVFFSKFNNQRFEVKQRAFDITCSQLSELLPQIRKRYRTQMWLFIIGIACCVAGFPLFLRYHHFAFAAVSFLGVLLICSFLHVSGMFQKQRVIRQISQGMVPIDNVWPPHIDEN